MSNIGISDITSSSDQWGEVMDYLSEILGLNKYFLDEPCQQSLATYSPPDEKRWKNSMYNAKYPLLGNIVDL